MPLAWKPNATVTVSLAADRDIPANDRPGFTVKFCTESVAQEIDAAFADPKATAATMREALARIVSGWVNAPPSAGAYKGAESLACLTPMELCELKDAALWWGAASGPFAGSSASQP